MSESGDVRFEAADRLEPRFPARTTVKVIGLGGVGSIVADHVILWLCAQATTHPGVSFRCVLIDGDEFEPSNHRMFFRRCGNKAEVRREDLIDRLGDRLEGVTISAVKEYVTPDNIDRLIHDGDFVLMCVDAHASRKVISEYFSRNIRDGVLISAGNEGAGHDPVTKRTTRGTFGNCQVYVRQAGKDASPSLTEFHPEIQDPQDALPTEEDCVAQIASVPQLLCANMWAAAAIFSTLCLAVCGPGVLKYSELVFDLYEGRMSPVDIPQPALA